MGILEGFSLKDKVALVTGGAGAYGKQIVEALAEAGAETFMASRNMENLKRQAGKFREAGLRITPLQFDQGEEDSIVDLAERIEEIAGGTDILVNNAVFKIKRGWSIPAEDFARSMQVNATGLFVMVRTFGERMAARGGGSIINIGSTFGMIGPDYSLWQGLEGRGLPDYFFHKGGLLQLTRFAASRFGPSGVRVNTISPGGLFAGQDPKHVKLYSDRTLLGRMANETDLKGAVVFLASEASAYVTGANLVVDGGYTAL